MNFCNECAEYIPWYKQFCNIKCMTLAKQRFILNSPEIFSSKITRQFSIFIKLFAEFSHTEEFQDPGSRILLRMDLHDNPQ